MPPNDPQQLLWNPAVETLSRDALRALQWDRLTRQLRYNHDSSAFYRAQFARAGAEPGDIRSFEDFARLPLMDKADQRAAQQESLDRFGNPVRTARLRAAREDRPHRLNLGHQRYADPLHPHGARYLRDQRNACAQILARRHPARRCHASGRVAQHVHRRPAIVRRHPASRRLRRPGRHRRRYRPGACNISISPGPRLCWQPRPSAAI